MTINSVTSNSGLYEAMVQQAAALRAAPGSRHLPSPAAPPQSGQSAATQSESPEAASFAKSLSAHARAIESRPLALPAPARPDAPPRQNRVADVYRGPSTETNRLVVQTRAPGALTGPARGETAGTTSTPPEADEPKPTFVEVHSVYVDATDEESARSSRSPLFQFASQLYRHVVSTNRRSAAGEYIGSSFSAIA